MQFSVAIVTLLAASVTATTCGFPGTVCRRDNSKRSVGFTTRARALLRGPDVEASKVARDIVAADIVEAKI